MRVKAAFSLLIGLAIGLPLFAGCYRHTHTSERILNPIVHGLVSDNGLRLGGPGMSHTERQRQLPEGALGFHVTLEAADENEFCFRVSSRGILENQSDSRWMRWTPEKYRRIYALADGKRVEDCKVELHEPTTADHQGLVPWSDPGGETRACSWREDCGGDTVTTAPQSGLRPGTTTIYTSEATLCFPNEGTLTRTTSLLAIVFDHGQRDTYEWALR